MSDGLTVVPNVFQRLMLQWERFAPYNAAQYMTLSASLDPAHVATTWRDVVLTLGLQKIGQHPDDAPQHADGPIEAFITRELNREFELGDAPLRPFVINDGPRPHVGIVYRHVIADSASIRFLMREWFERLLLRPSTTAPSPPAHIGLLPPGAVGPTPRSWGRTKSVIREMMRASRAKRVRRLPDSTSPSSPLGWTRLDLPTYFIARTLKYARRAGVKLNDLFVTSAALACDELLPHEHSDKRPDIGIGTIVDVRPARQPPHSHFGVSLGFLQTFWRWQDLKTFDSTLRVAAAQSKIARDGGHAHASLLPMSIAAWHGQRTKHDDALATFYRKRCPLAAGISNVNLNLDWPAKHHPSPLADYTRVSPLGPMLPIVFTPTTLGTNANLGVTWRRDLLDDMAAHQLIDRFVALLDRLQ